MAGTKETAESRDRKHHSPEGLLRDIWMRPPPVPEWAYKFSSKERRTPFPEHKDAINLKQRARDHGLSIIQLLTLQAQGCAFCGKKEHPHIDHDHRTGKVRGVLCAGHNVGLGRIETLSITRVAEYLSRLPMKSE